MFAESAGLVDDRCGGRRIWLLRGLRRERHMAQRKAALHRAALLPGAARVFCAARSRAARLRAAQTVHPSEPHFASFTECERWSRVRWHTGYLPRSTLHQ